jgi:hypothetical protein
MNRSAPLLHPSLLGIGVMDRRDEDKPRGERRSEKERPPTNAEGAHSFWEACTLMLIAAGVFVVE